MALFDLFGKKRKQPKKARLEGSRILDASETASGPASPSLAAPASPILRSFHVSEKSTRGLGMNQYTFLVDDKVTKTQVRDAVKKSYSVDVVSVNMVRLPAKGRTMGRRKGFVPGKRKAIVSLKAGQSIAAAQP